MAVGSIPPWQAKLWANLPITLLFTLFAFFYFGYLQMYLLKLLMGTYTSATSDTSSVLESSTAFIAMKTLTRFTNQLMSKVLDDTADLREKGIIYAVILHVFMCFFLYSALRVIFTNPGNVPKDWNNKVEEQISQAIEVEKRILQNIRKRAKQQRLLDQTDDKFNTSKITEDADESKLAESHRESLVHHSDIARESLIGRGDEVADSQSPRRGEDRPSGNGNNEGKPSEAGVMEGEYEIQGQGGPTGDDSFDEEAYREREEFAMQIEGFNLRTDDITQDKIHQYAVMSALSRQKRRFCAHCQRFKPERTHHCRQCGICVLKMDHHCPWVNNCVGFLNYKYFLTMLLYGDACLLFIGITFTEVITDTLFDTSISVFTLYFYLVYYLLALVMGVILLIFFSFHIWLVVNARTTLEFCEKKRESNYDKGLLSNLKEALGTNYLLWIFPCGVNTKFGSGLD